MRKATLAVVFAATSATLADVHKRPSTSMGADDNLKWARLYAGLCSLLVLMGMAVVERLPDRVSSTAVGENHRKA